MKRGKNKSSKVVCSDIGRAFLGLACLTALALPSQVLADVYTPTVVWDNSGADGNYTSSGWSTGSEPNGGSLAAINNGATVTIDQAGEVAAQLRLASTISDSGYVLMTGGDIYISSQLRVGDEGTGTWTQTGGDLVANDVLWIGARGLGYDANAIGTFNLQGGTVTVNGTSSTDMRIGRAGGEGILNISGGTWTTAGQFNIAALPAADDYPSKGSVNLSGTGVLNVGTTLLNDATGGDPGEALLSLTGSNVTVSALSYAHRPDATLSYIADASGISPITVIDGAGGVSIQDGELLIDLSAMTSTPSTIVLIDNQQPDPISGEFLNAPEGTMFGDYTLTYLYDGGDGDANDLALILANILEGDLNGDGFVGLDDLDIILNNWNTNTTPGDLLTGDPSGDGYVGLDDLDVVLNNWNAGTPSASVVPEPAAMGVMLLASLGLLRRK